MASQNRDIHQRKQDHIDFIRQDKQIERHSTGFDDIHLSHRALPEIDYAAIDSTTTFLGKKMTFPLLISSMTGGAGDNFNNINRHLALAAEEHQIALAVGSQRAMIVDSAAEQSFKLRQYAPSIPLIANLGAVQLNYGFGLSEARKAIETLEADALYLHLNPLQEVIQPEGDTNFAKLLPKIEQLTEQLDVPVILKEVGCGLSATDIQRGLDSGIKWFDLAGRGGTSWSRIEAHRSNNDLGILFQDWGLTTPQALNIARDFQEQGRFIASGGIRNGIDMVKSVIMGGQICGVAAPFLEAAMQSECAVGEKIEAFEQAFRTAQFLLGAQNISELFLNDSLIES